MAMDEHFLHYIWKYQKFSIPNPQLTNGQSLVVFNTGYHNHDSGPDFEEARIKIDDVEWAGHVEIHINASDWNRHNHQTDKAYENVILHVVWNADQDVCIQNTPIPTLELKDIVDFQLLDKYKNHLNTSLPVLCTEYLSRRETMAYSAMIDRVLVERLEQKAEKISTLLKDLGNDWEAFSYVSLCHNFGFATNKHAFAELAHKLPYDVLKKNLNDPIKTQALIFGQSGFLENATDTFQEQLKTEHSYLSAKYKLADPMQSHQWKMGKMRPANFPSVRLSQFSALLCHQPKLFSSLISIQSPKEMIQLFNFELFPYWQSHYDFGKKSIKPIAAPGRSTRENILINTAAPLLAAYSKYSGKQEFMDRAIHLLETIKPEKNRITKIWDEIGKSASSAFESQAQIQLYSEYCSMKKCLQCTIGIEILHKS